MFTFKRKIDFYDCDPAGIMFYGRVNELCHAAYEAMIESFELAEDYWNNNNYVVPIINSEAHYHRPVTYKEVITVNINVSQLKDKSFELEYVTFNEKGEKCHKVRTVHVFIDKASWKKREMPETIHKALYKHKI